MNIEDTKRLEHVCLKSDLDLKTFGDKFQLVFSLPTMEHDYENENEWLTADKDGINYNISKPYEEGTLQEWDDKTPKGCNFGISISIHKNHPSVLDNIWIEKMVTNVCEELAKTYNTKVYHHRTFIFGIGNEWKNGVFNP